MLNRLLLLTQLKSSYFPKILFLVLNTVCPKFEKFYPVPFQKILFFGLNEIFGINFVFGNEGKGN